MSSYDRASPNELQGFSVGRRMVRTWLLAAAAAAVASTPCLAAPQVVPERRFPPLGVYDAAASRAGVPEWGAIAQYPHVVRVLVRLQADRASLTFVLPADVPLARAEAWLQRLSDTLGWTSVDLYSSPQPGMLLMRAAVRDMVSPPRRGRSRATLDLPAIARGLRELSRRGLLAVRMTGAEVVSVSPEPWKRDHHGDDTFLFYRLSDKTARNGAPLRVEYGLPDRWLAAAASAYVIWLLFPYIALLAVRALLAKGAGPDPRAKVTLYRRWQRGVTMAAVLCAFGSSFAVGAGKMVYILGAAGPALPSLLFLLPICALTVGARVVGLPLEWVVWPSRRELPWYRAASAELYLAGLLLLCGAAVLWLTRPASGAVVISSPGHATLKRPEDAIPAYTQLHSQR